MLASWAIPKGPILDPKVRRMAVHVEDHPIEYFDFEGVIPKAQYGAGDVIVWDWGTYDPEEETPDPKEAIDDGELKFELHGQKLNGRFTLVRTSRRPGSAPTTAFEDDSEQWLLIKKRDASSIDGLGYGGAPAVGQDRPDQRRGQGGTRAPSGSATCRPRPPRSTSPARSRRRCPGSSRRCSPRSRSTPFSDPDWLFEIKWDGYRLQAIVDDGKVRTYTRKGLDGSTYFPGLLSSPASWITAGQAIVDGEVVALDENGAPDFGLLQEGISSLRAGTRSASAGSGTKATLVYQAFDLLYLDGRALLNVPLEDRKRLLRSRCSARADASDSPRTSRPTGWPSTRRRRAASWKGSSPSSVARDTSRAAARQPG